MSDTEKSIACGGGMGGEAKAIPELLCFVLKLFYA